MAWKEIKRVEHIIRRERGDKAIIIRLIKEDEKVASLILGLEDKNSKNSIELSIIDWEDLIAFFNSVDSEIKAPQIPKEVKLTEPTPIDIDLQPSSMDLAQETKIPVPRVDLIASETEEPKSDVIILHKKIPSTIKVIAEKPSLEPEIKETPEAVVIKPPEMLQPEEVKPTEVPEVSKLPTPQAVVIEHIEPPIKKEAEKIEQEIKPIPSVSVIDEAKPSLEPESVKPEITHIEPKPVEVEELTPSSGTEELYPPMPPEVQEIFEELDNQAIELEKTLLDGGENSNEGGISKEVKITSAMQEVAELMPPGAAKDFVEQMILKRKENVEVTDEKPKSPEVELVIVNENQDEPKNKGKKTEDTKNELKYW